MDELLEEIDLNLGAFKRFIQWLSPVAGSDFKHLSSRLLARQHKLANSNKE
ncbi:MAG: hypothetical protein SH820_04680 [Xanthomonadales bacterium]|nr:hypothetical protein [Xanthomonadales bacterium]